MKKLTAALGAMSLVLGIAGCSSPALPDEVMQTLRIDASGLGSDWIQADNLENWSYVDAARMGDACGFEGSAKYKGAVLSGTASKIDNDNLIGQSQSAYLAVYSFPDSATRGAARDEVAKAFEECINPTSIDPGASMQDGGVEIDIRNVNATKLDDSQKTFGLPCGDCYMIDFTGKVYQRQAGTTSAYSEVSAGRAGALFIGDYLVIISMVSTDFTGDAETPPNWGFIAEEVQRQLAAQAK